MFAAIANRYYPVAGSRWWPDVLTPGRPEIDAMNDNPEKGERSTPPEGAADAERRALLDRLLVL